MAYDIGPKIGIDGEAEFRKQLQSINTDIKTLGSEMKVVTSAFIGQEKSAESLSAQNDVLGRMVDELNKKLEAQTTFLEKAVNDGLNPASDEYKKWQQAINNTQAELNSASAQIAANEKAMDGLTKSTFSAEKAQEALKSTMHKLGEAAATAGKAVAATLAAAVTAASAAVVKLTKDAVEGAAAYEQLIGGVETLFGESAGVVERYANNAFKTAGLSANEYMETVTGFSASLLQGLGGDTAEAARVADMAITDMADNANKMGSDISSIQSAYQGFAKQNYTMLDNLKLGYGGTKTEMERLLADAEKLSGVEYNIENLNDVYEAIHVVQTEMGITGTTAKEASETISGSVAAMKSAWSNLVTGLAGNADSLDELIANFVESAETAAKNVLPAIKAALAGISELISELGPIIVDTLPELVKEILPQAIDAIMSITEALVDVLPDVVDALIEIMPMFVDAILDALPQLIEAGIEVTIALALGITRALPDLIARVPEIIQGIIDVFDKNANEWRMAGQQILAGIGKGLQEALKALLETVSNVGSRILNRFKEVLGIHSPSTVFRDQIGVNIGLGVAEGIESEITAVIDAATRAAQAATDAAKDALGTHSPSTVFAGIGKNMALGIGVGFSDTMRGVEQNMRAVLPTPDISLADAASGIVNGLGTQLDGFARSITVHAVLQLPDGTQLAEYYLPSFIDVGNANGTPIASPIYT